MNNYGRDDLFDPATWADIDQAVLEEAKRVRVARKVFRTEDVRTADGRAPSWVSVAQVERPQSPTGPLRIPEGDARPFVEISVPFWLTPAQVEAEDTLHTARTLARMAAKWLALAEDQIIFRGEANLGDNVIATNTEQLVGLAARFRPGGSEPLPYVAYAPATDATHADRARHLIDRVTLCIAELAAAGSPEPYGLVLAPDVYLALWSRLEPSSGETPASLLAGRIRHHAISDALDDGTGLLISLAGDPITIYAAHEACTTFTGELLGDTGAVCAFRVFERFQYANRDPGSIRFLGPEPRGGPAGDVNERTAKTSSRPLNRSWKSWTLRSWRALAASVRVRFNRA